MAPFVERNIPGTFRRLRRSTVSSSAPRGLAIAVDPTAPTTVHAGTSGGGVFVSTDGGSADHGRTLLGNVDGLAIHATSPGTLWVATYLEGIQRLE